MIDPIREGSSATIHLVFRKGGKPLSYEGYTVEAEGRLPSGTLFPVTITPVDKLAGTADATVLAEQVTEGDGDLVIEFDFIAEAEDAPFLNPNARPLRIPLRPRHGDAS